MVAMPVASGVMRKGVPPACGVTLNWKPLRSGLGGLSGVPPSFAWIVLVRRRAPGGSWELVQATGVSWPERTATFARGPVASLRPWLLVYAMS